MRLSPRQALRGVISKVNFHQVFQLLTTISHKMAPRTGQSGAGITPRRAFCGLLSRAPQGDTCNDPPLWEIRAVTRLVQPPPVLHNPLLSSTHPPFTPSVYLSRTHTHTHQFTDSPTRARTLALTHAFTNSNVFLRTHSPTQ